ncbi:CoA ester lyase [Frankia sp. CiP3]|uniref:HpcH/HpaI aldolase/citrate lyase family protein n=1 Tax=Frankia sp. CiP3 TaxID=2880971 RepID=UPI001EF4414A|nr:CoA ester lyase [Frankia sp. CiP3]
MRSYLNVPAHSERKFKSAQSTSADAILLDLEDGVAPGDKLLARETLSRVLSLSYLAPPRPRIGVRINAVDTLHAGLDMECLAACEVRPDFMVIPMVTSPRDVEIVSTWAGRYGWEPSLCVLIETADGVEAVNSICRESVPALKGVFIGTADYANDIAAFVNEADFTYLRQRVVNAARASRLAVLDAPHFQLSDTIGLKASSDRSFRQGFSGRIALHPDQIDVINRSYSPTEADLKHAREILEAAAATESGIARSRGGMVGPPFYEHSKRIVALAADAASTNEDRNYTRTAI